MLVLDYISRPSILRLPTENNGYHSKPEGTDAMTREEKLKIIWRHTHRDYKGKLETGERDPCLARRSRYLLGSACLSHRSRD